MTPEHIAVAVAIISFGTAALNIVSEILSSRSPQEKTLGF